MRMLVILIVCVTSLDDVMGHGGMVEPPMRSVMWKYGFDSPVNYDWMALYCGGFGNFQQNGGRCGLCGDPYQGPIENDRGGVYDTGVIVRHYPEGLREIEVKVELTAHHKGHFRFKLCPNNEAGLTQQCLDRYPLVIREGRQQGDPYRYFPPENPKLHELHVQLPPDVTCDRCVLQWTYTAGNNVGQSQDGTSCMGCGLQETFINCADISIGGTRDSVPVAQGDNPATFGPEIVIPATANVTNINDVIQTLGIPTMADPRTGPVSNQGRTGQFSEWNGGMESFPNTNVGQNIPASRVVFSNNGPSISQGISPGNMVPVSHQQEWMQPRNSFPGNQPSNNFLPPLNPPLNMPDPMSGALSHANLPRNHGNTFGFNHPGVIANHGRHSTLLGTLDPIVSGIQRHQQMQPLTDARAWEHGSHFADVRTRADLHGVLPAPGTMLSDVYRLQNSVHQGQNWGHEHMMTSQNGDPLNALATRTMQHRMAVNPSPETLQRMRQRSIILNDMRRAQSMSHAALPRRIVVHSTAVAQTLLRRYPQLRGRVFLSREARLQNQQAHLMHKYRQRQHWL